MHTSRSDPGSFHLWSAFGKQSHDLGITEIQRRAIVRKELPLEFEGDWKHVFVHLKLSQHCYLAILQYKIKGLKTKSNKNDAKQLCIHMKKKKNFLQIEGKTFHLLCHCSPEAAVAAIMVHRHFSLSSSS